MNNDSFPFVFGGVIGIVAVAIAVAILALDSARSEQRLLKQACGECIQLGKICGTKVCTSDKEWR